MSTLEMPNPSVVLTEVVEDTCFANPDRFGSLLNDIRSLLRSLAPDVTSGNIAKTVRAGVYFLRTSHNRRDVIADFFDVYPASTTAAEILATMECG